MLTGKHSTDGGTLGTAAPPHQCTEDALALRDGGHLLQRELSKAQLTGHQGVHGQLPVGTVARRGHLHRR